MKSEVQGFISPSSNENLDGMLSDTEQWLVTFNESGFSISRRGEYYDVSDVSYAELRELKNLIDDVLTLRLTGVI